ncbi:MAG: archaemetzincin [Pirellulales bacterium]|nr:archaemetzincin [Pirellulales bacterium]
MRWILLTVVLSIITWVVVVSWPQAADLPATPESNRAQAVLERVKPLHRAKEKPRPGDWLAEHEEDGQTFAEYRADNPVLPQGKRKTIYLQPLGEFDTNQQRMVDLTAEYLRIHFDRPVKLLKTLPSSTVPDSARRKHPSWGMEQILTTYVMDNILRPKLPEDAAAMIALTSTDLWPGKGWNYVFGQAYLRHRVGVWSIYRNGDPAKEFPLALERTIKTAAHEIGHMFSMEHCIVYECLMNGANNRAESDRHPLALCPDCIAKVCWATGTNPAKRFQSLAKFCAREELDDQAEFFRRSAARFAD